MDAKALAGHLKDDVLFDRIEVLQSYMASLPSALHPSIPPSFPALHFPPSLALLLPSKQLT